MTDELVEDHHDQLLDLSKDELLGLVGEHIAEITRLNTQLEAWHEMFDTTQLTHAVAAKEQAESALATAERERDLAESRRADALEHFKMGQTALTNMKRELDEARKALRTAQLLIDKSLTRTTTADERVQMRTQFTLAHQEKPSMSQPLIDSIRAFNDQLARWWIEHRDECDAGVKYQENVRPAACVLMCELEEMTERVQADWTSQCPLRAYNEVRTIALKYLDETMPEMDERSGITGVEFEDRNDKAQLSTASRILIDYLKEHGDE